MASRRNKNNKKAQEKAAEIDKSVEETQQSVEFVRDAVQPDAQITAGNANNDASVLESVEIVQQPLIAEVAENVEIVQVVAHVPEENFVAAAEEVHAVVVEEEEEEEVQHAAEVAQIVQQEGVLPIIEGGDAEEVQLVAEIEAANAAPAEAVEVVAEAVEVVAEAVEVVAEVVEEAAVEIAAEHVHQEEAQEVQTVVSENLYASAEAEHVATVVEQVEAVAPIIAEANVQEVHAEVIAEEHLEQVADVIAEEVSEVIAEEVVEAVAQEITEILAQEVTEVFAQEETAGEPEEETAGEPEEETAGGPEEETAGGPEEETAGGVDLQEVSSNLGEAPPAEVETKPQAVVYFTHAEHHEELEPVKAVPQEGDAVEAPEQNAPTQQTNQSTNQGPSPFWNTTTKVVAVGLSALVLLSLKFLRK